MNFYDFFKYKFQTFNEKQISVFETFLNRIQLKLENP